MTALSFITRVVHACVLLELGEDAVLTDPYFEQRWFMRLKEPIGMSVAELPRLTAILGGHGVFDHWQPALIPIHYALKPVPLLLQTSGTCEQLVELARRESDVTVVPLETGRRWKYERVSA
jgi:L-ascorbate metabolism protein UlaG (beta-lactamase superfamily)